MVDGFRAAPCLLVVWGASIGCATARCPDGLQAVDGVCVSVDAGTSDGGIDAGMEAGASDGGVDTDAMADGAIDAAADAMVDGAIDGGVDAAADAMADGAIDAAMGQANVRFAGPGVGRVQTQGGDQECIADCAVDVVGEAELIAEAGPGSEFEKWEGACSGTGACTVAPGDAVTARFKHQYNVAFVTSEREFPKDFGGLAGADAWCADLAEAAGLPGNPDSYIAWLATAEQAPIDRISLSRGWVRPDNQPFLDEHDDLFFVRYPPRVTELGEDLGTDPDRVATGTMYTGMLDDSETRGNCLDWNGDDEMSALSGWPHRGDDQWTHSTGLSCRAMSRIYCFGTGIVRELEHEEIEGRRVFVTRFAYIVGGGLVMDDARCQDDADLFNLNGTFLAMLPTSTASAANRFPIEGPNFVRMDGLPLADSAEEFLTQGPTQVPPNLKADRTPQTNNLVRAGVTSFTESGTADTTCGDWTMADTGFEAPLWNIGATGPDFFDDQTNIICDFLFPTLCVEVLEDEEE